MKKIIASALLSAVCLAGCAKSPSAIAPVYIPAEAYSRQSCVSLAQELRQEQSTLTVVSQEQKNAKLGDTLGVFLIAVPVSSVFGGDKGGDVAVAKGKVQAIELAMKNKNCRK